MRYMCYNNNIYYTIGIIYYYFTSWARTYNLTNYDNIIIIISGRRRERCDGGCDTRRPAHPASNDKWHQSYGAVRPLCGDTAAATAAATQRLHWHTGRRRRIVSSRCSPHGPHNVTAAVAVVVVVVVRVSVCPFARASVCECQQLAATVNRAQQSHTASVRGPPSVVFGRTSLQRVVVTATACFSVVTRYFSSMRFFSTYSKETIILSSIIASVVVYNNIILTRYLYIIRQLLLCGIRRKYKFWILKWFVTLKKIVCILFASVFFSAPCNSLYLNPPTHTNANHPTPTTHTSVAER